MKAPLFCALALATATGAARAEESSLSLYGVIDAGLINQRVTGPQGVRTSHTGMVSGGLTDTLFGVRGHEDLGGGLAAKFQFESMFNLARGETSDADHFFNNAAWVGLASENLGEIRLGRQHTAAQQFASQLEAASWVNMGMGSTFRASDNYQVKNAIGYLSPAWGGVSLGLTYSFDAAGDQIKGQTQMAVGPPPEGMDHARHRAGDALQPRLQRDAFAQRLLGGASLRDVLAGTGQESRPPRRAFALEVRARRDREPAHAAVCAHLSQVDLGPAGRRRRVEQGL